MLVKELIKDTVWIPSESYETSQPEISVLLPTYSRGKSGLFQKAVCSILNQTFSNFELIIVDDASVDGTREQIKQFMQEDKRISCLIHSKNIGLPAISEYEAFMKSRGKYIIFAFDDFIFEPSAFDILYKEITTSNSYFCHGQANLYYLESGIEKSVLHGNYDSLDINRMNLIPNAAVIVAKEVFYQVGLYDPHVILARLCDWDLWVRTSQKFYIKKIDALIGHEYGCTTKDSLGALFQINTDLVRHYIHINRNTSLLPQHYEDVSIFDSIPGMNSSDAHFYIEQLLQSYSTKNWYLSSNLNKSLDLKKPLKIVFYAQDLTNFNLCFSFLDLTHHVIVDCITPFTLSYDIQRLSRADVVILDRLLHSNLGLIELLKLIKIPCYYFIDDNFLLLSAEYPMLEWYTQENMSQILTQFEGVFTSTIALRDFFIKEKLHTNVLCWPPVLNKQLSSAYSREQSTRADQLNIAIVGGQFRSKYINEMIIPTLNELAQHCSVRLYIRRDILDSKSMINFFIEEFDFQGNYNQFIHFLSSKNIDLLIHSPAETSNLPYKTNSILLTAYYINANIIVPDEPAFVRINEQQGIYKLTLNSDGLISTLEKFLDPSFAEKMKEKLKSYCLKQFASEKATPALSSILDRHQPINYLTYETRKSILIDHLFASTSHVKNQNEVQTNFPEINNLFNLKDYLNVKFYSIVNTVKYRYSVKETRGVKSPPFQTLKTRFLENNSSSGGFKLKVGHLLSHKSFMEYRLQTPVETFSSITLACKNANAKTGILGIEIVLPNGEIGAHVAHQISALDFSHPITFNFPSIKLPKKSNILVRVFARQIQSPIFIYECHNKKIKFNFRKRKTLFCTLDGEFK